MFTPEILAQTGYRNGLLLLTLLSVAIINIFPMLSYPFELFSTMIHELGHVMAAILTGGKIESFFIREDGSGLTTSKGADEWFLNQAGYVGTSLFSAMLMVLSGFPAYAPYALGFLGLGLIVLALGFSWRYCLTVVIAIIFGSIFIGVALRAPLGWSVFLLNLIAIQLGILALSSLINLGQFVKRGSQGEVKDDATQMSENFGCSPIFWARLWLLLSAGALAGAFWFTWLRNLAA
jgi:hypothetical protein